MLTTFTQTARETQDTGRALAALLRPGDVVLLTGRMGAGKSEFARGVARGLGVGGPVPSPSFTILNAYDEGRIPLYHFDFYRLNSEDELYQIGLDEQLGGDGAALVEWHERAPSALPDDCLEVRIAPEGERRRIDIRSRGAFRALRIPGMEGEST